MAFPPDGKAALVGLVQGFTEEQWSKHPIDAPITNRVTVSLRDVNTAQTNQFAVTVVTEANPNLMWVTPVDELALLPENQAFITNIVVTAMLATNYSLKVAF